MSDTVSDARAMLWTADCVIARLRRPDGQVTTLDPRKPYLHLSGKELGDATRRGLYLHAAPQGIYCLDLDRGPNEGVSSNGWLNSSGEFRWGESLARVILDRAPIEPFSSNSVERDPLAGDLSPRLELHSKGSAGPDAPSLYIRSARGLQKADYKVTRRLTLVGKASPCMIRLDDSRVEDIHALFYWSDGALWVVDLSGGDTLLRGQSVEVASVAPSDTLQIGAFLMDFGTSRRRSDAPDARIASPFESSAESRTQGADRLDDGVRSLGELLKRRQLAELELERRLESLSAECQAYRRQAEAIHLREADWNEERKELLDYLAAAQRQSGRMHSEITNLRAALIESRELRKELIGTRDDLARLTRELAEARRSRYDVRRRDRDVAVGSVVGRENPQAPSKIPREPSAFPAIESPPERSATTRDVAPASNPESGD